LKANHKTSHALFKFFWKSGWWIHWKRASLNVTVPINSPTDGRFPAELADLGREGHGASSDVTVSEGIENRTDTCATRSAPQPSPPPSDCEDTPKEVIIRRSYAKRGFGRVPLQFCPAQGGLSGEPFNPYGLRLTPHWDQTLVMTDDDVAGLPRLLGEMTKHIPSIEDHDLIEHLRGGVKPTKDLHSGHGAGITRVLLALHPLSS